MTGNDEGRLFELLARALEPPSEEPPAAGLSSLHQAVALRAATLREQELSTGRVRPLLAWFRRPIPALAGLLVLTSVGTAGAIATGATLPGPVREVVHAIGIPVDSPELAKARTTLGHLLDAIEQRDLPAVRSLASELEAALDGLSGNDRSEISYDADEALDRAEALLGEQTGSDNRNGGDERDTSGPGGSDDGPDDERDTSGPGGNDGGDSDSDNSEDSDPFEGSAGPEGPQGPDGPDEPDSPDEPDEPDGSDSSGSGSDSSGSGSDSSGSGSDSSGSGSDSSGSGSDSSGSGSDSSGSDSSGVSL